MRPASGAIRPSSRATYSFLNRAVLELRLEVAERGVVLCDDDQAGGFLVEAVDDAGAQLAADTFDVRAVVEHGVDERVLGVAGRGMDDHAGRLVYDDDVVVFIDDDERDGLRLGEGGLRWGRGVHRHGLSGRQGL